MITSLIEMLFVGDVIYINYDVINFVSNTVVLRRPGVAIFAHIIKIINRFIEQIYKDSRKAKTTKNYVLKCNLYLYFLI